MSQRKPTVEPACASTTVCWRVLAIYSMFMYYLVNHAAFQSTMACSLHAFIKCSSKIPNQPWNKCLAISHGHFHSSAHRWLNWYKGHTCTLSLSLKHRHRKKLPRYLSVHYHVGRLIRYTIGSLPSSVGLCHDPVSESATANVRCSCGGHNGHIGLSEEEQQLNIK